MINIKGRESESARSAETMKGLLESMDFTSAENASGILEMTLVSRNIKATNIMINNVIVMKKKYNGNGGFGVNTSPFNPSKCPDHKRAGEGE